ncbi:MAG: protein translocase subunit SecD [Proteobacteria bacterium]|nr:protein translocase subunit SecD [Pseudomonadota bacterium]
MNQYPIWKNLIVFIIVGIGCVYTVPNFYGESPAVQISATGSSVKIDTALMDKVISILSEENMNPSEIYREDSSIKLRFDTADAQIQSKDVLQNELGEGVVVALNLLPNSPRWFGSLGALPMYLGLDLRGGVHFLLQVDMQDARVKAIERYSQDVRQVLREKSIRYSGISLLKSSLIVEFRDQQSVDSSMDILVEEVPNLNITSLIGSGEFKILCALSDDMIVQIEEYAIEQNLTTLRKRVNELGVAEPIVQKSGKDRIVVQLPGVQDTAKAKDILGRTASLEVRLLDEEKMDSTTLQASVSGQVPFGVDLLFDRTGVPYLLKKNIILTGERIADAQPGFDGQTGEPAVHLTLDGRGASIFQRATRENVGRRIAMVLSEKGSSEVVTAPVVRQEIGGGRVQISGQMTTTEARDVALLLRSGALAAPMEIIEERTVGPSLGAENITKGFRSTWIGFLALALFIAVYYNLFGIFSVVALVVNLTLLVSLLSMLQATLTLPGFAAIALTLGMAIDANVLINERIREEIRAGITPQAAIAAGYERAWATILDSNVTTLIAGIALFYFGSGPIRGFAVVHCLGILTSVFSAVLVSRAMVNFVFGRRRQIDRLPIGNTDWHKSSKVTSS